ncbi:MULTISPECIES: hypothetical protein [unclassified Streptomyces]|uniref:hypothetical protein n=1 Tax=unclassified Streptomyces TaxID=2593676 RepID=UPI002E13459C|nr:hypothetical protein OG299_07145 [Streptomyces sp. NBC_01296]WSW63266.1 hypothetical protein OG513_34475 [Streptomyces sp. NBC_00998]
MGFGLYLAVPIGVVALLLAVSGVATLSRGWLLPWQRRHIVRPRLFGWAQLLIAAALGVELVGLLVVDSGYRSVVTMPGVVGLLFALVLSTRAQRPPRTR